MTATLLTPGMVRARTEPIGTGAGHLSAPLLACPGIG
jgi:hypothetical protein